MSSDCFSFLIVHERSNGLLLALVFFLDVHNTVLGSRSKNKTKCNNSIKKEENVTNFYSGHTKITVQHQTVKISETTMDIGMLLLNAL
jgi:hypothetical protein